VLTFQGKKGLILLDQMRTLDKPKLVKKIGVVNSKTLTATLETLQEVLAIRISWLK
jgi:mRNA interferase MazF